MAAPPAVVVGLQENGLGVARALHAAGVACVAVDGTGWHPAHATRCCEVRTAPAWTAEALVDTLVGLGHELGRRAPLLLTQDESVLWVSDARETLETHYEIVLPGAETVRLLMDKTAFLRRAEAEGWPVPRTWTAQDHDELLRCLPDVVFPCVLKPQVKNSAFRRHSPKKAFKVADRSELVAAYELVSQWEKEVVIQEWVEGGDDRIAFCLGYVDRAGEPVVVFSGRKLRQWPPECGNTALSEPAPASWVEPIDRLTREIWQRVGFRGLGSVEYKMRPGSEEPVIMEPTVGRTNFQNELSVINGVNIPLAAYCDGVGRSFPAPTPSRQEVKLVSGVGELRAAWEYWRAGQLGPGRWWADRGGAKRFMLWRAADPGPALAILQRRLRGVATGLARRLLGRRNTG